MSAGSRWAGEAHPCDISRHASSPSAGSAGSPPLGPAFSPPATPSSRGRACPEPLASLESFSGFGARGLVPSCRRSSRLGPQHGECVRTNPWASTGTRSCVVHRNPTSGPLPCVQATSALRAWDTSGGQHVATTSGVSCWALHTDRRMAASGPVQAGVRLLDALRFLSGCAAHPL
jgi:hypothetical protein